MKKLVTVTDMMRSFSEIIGRVYYKQESYYIKRGHNIVARLLPVQKNSSIQVKDLNHLFKSSISLISEEDRSDFEYVMKKSRTLSARGDKWD